MKNISLQQPPREFVFKKLTKDDVPLLLLWFKEPHVAKWWPTPEKDEEIIEKFLTRIRSKDTFGYLVLLNGVAIGYIQYYHIDRTHEKGAWLPSEITKTTIGTDQFIGDPQHLGKGLGVRFIKEFIGYLHEIVPTITTIIVDPDPANQAAIRCYEKVGFKRVDFYNAPWGKALLMRYDLQ